VGPTFMVGLVFVVMPTFMVGLVFFVVPTFMVGLFFHFVLGRASLAPYLKPNGGRRGARTPDSRLVRAVLYQLSYSPATLIVLR
jgi:hypothetical protein